MTSILIFIVIVTIITIIITIAIIILIVTIVMGLCALRPGFLHAALGVPVGDFRLSVPMHLGFKV